MIVDFVDQFDRVHYKDGRVGPSPVGEEALRLLDDEHRSVFPVGMDKAPTIPSWKPRQYRLPNRDEVWKHYDRFPEHGVAIACGRVSDLTVVDLDDSDSLNRFLDTYPDASSTKRVSTPHGQHFFFRYAGKGIGNSQSQLMPKCDVKTFGGYVMTAPSRIIDDKTGRYADYDLFNRHAPVQEMPDKLRRDLLALNGHPKFQPSLARIAHTTGARTVLNGGKWWIPYHQRNAYLVSRAGILFRAGISPEAIKACLLVEKRVACAPYPVMPDLEVLTIVHSVGLRHPQTH